MRIGGFQKSSLIDYPGQISAIIFTQGCNFRCPYCHNPELLANSDNSDYYADSILEFLKTRQGKLDAVVITGGEPTLHSDLPDFIQKIKDMNFLIKLDTNGTNPNMLHSLLDKKLIDYVAMDIKAPIEKYSEVACANVNTENILKSIEIVKNSGINYEFRTTIVKSQLSFEDFENIGELISGAQAYYLQKFVPTKTLDPKYLSELTYSDHDFSEIIKIIEKTLENVLIR